MVRGSFGNTAAASVDEVKPDHLPLVLIVCKQKGGYNVYTILHGTTSFGGGGGGWPGTVGVEGGTVSHSWVGSLVLVG